MKAFVNELSLESHNDWSVVLQFFYRATMALRRSGVLILRDGDYYVGEEFKRRFNSTSLPKDVKAEVRKLLFSKQYTTCWRSDRISDPEVDYLLLDCDVQEAAMRDDSVCEAAERVHQDKEVPLTLVSDENSRFGKDPLVKVERQGWEVSTCVENLFSHEALREWICRHGDSYDPTSHAAPNDCQTIIAKAVERFRRTGRMSLVAGKYRRIYEEQETLNHYYVDEGHPGYSAHLEVFDSQGRHLGEACIDTGRLKAGTKVKGRTLRL